MAGYFKVPLAATRALMEISESPDLLAAYMVLRFHAYGPQRMFTAAGAKSVSKLTGFTGYRSKRLMNELRSLRFGERGELGLIEPTGRMVGNAAQYKLLPWDGPDAYLPALLVKPHESYGSELMRICDDEATSDVRRDALYLLLHLHAAVDYGGHLGAPPCSYPFQIWQREGEQGGYDLGRCGQQERLDVWLVAAPDEDDWRMPSNFTSRLFGADTAENAERVGAGLRCLRRCGAVCKVAVVTDGNSFYPLWVFSPGYRESLAELGVRADLADAIHRFAGDAGFDADNRLFIEATSSDMDEHGTGFFFCVGRDPVVHTLLVPRLHAPTPQNLDALNEVARITSELAKRVRVKRRALRSAA